MPTNGAHVLAMRRRPQPQPRTRARVSTSSQRRTPNPTHSPFMCSPPAKMSSASTSTTWFSVAVAAATATTNAPTTAVSAENAAPPSSAPRSVKTGPRGARTRQPPKADGGQKAKLAVHGSWSMLARPRNVLCEWRQRYLRPNVVEEVIAVGDPSTASQCTIWASRCAVGGAHFAG